MVDYFSCSPQPNYASVRQHCNIWRNYIDVQDSWENVKQIFKFYGENKQNFASFSGPGGFSDPDQVCENKYLSLCTLLLFAVPFEPRIVLGLCTLFFFLSFFFNLFLEFVCFVL